MIDIWEENYLVDGKETAQCLLAAVIFHVGIVVVPIISNSLLHIYGLVFILRTIAIIYMLSSGSVLNALRQGCLLSLLTTLRNRLGVVVIVIDWMVLQLLSQRRQLHHSIDHPLIQGVLDDASPYARLNVLGALVLQ